MGRRGLGGRGLGLVRRLDQRAGLKPRRQFVRLVLGALHRARSNVGSKRQTVPKKEAQKLSTFEEVHLDMDLKAAMKRRLTAEHQGRSPLADSGAGSSEIGESM